MSATTRAQVRPLRPRGPKGGAADLWVVGLNHETAPIELRERLVFPGDQLGAAAARIVAGTDAREAVVLSTCNRIEVIASAGREDELSGALTEFLANDRGVDIALLREHRYVHRGRDGVRHLFRVASSLDSMVIGESQILGQLKAQFSNAVESDAVAAFLRRCFERSFRVAKRVRTETEVATRAVSVSSAAVDLAQRIFDDLSGKTVMLMGAGKMSELAARHFIAAGVKNLIVTNRSFDRGVELARRFDGTPVPFDRYHEYLAMVDIVLGSVGADGTILGPSDLTAALKSRRSRPMFFIDLGVPRNFDAAINDLEGCYLYDIDSLAGVAKDHRAERAKEARKAEAIVLEEADGLWRQLQSPDLTPTIVALRGKLEGIRRSELDRAMATLRRLEPEDREALESMTQAIVNKILHAPMKVLKELAREEDSGGASDAQEFVHHLFELGSEPRIDEDDQE
ncbi:MAG: glutamyl-tRNA reductase [Deltaproteobacteria bacterium]